MQEDIQISVNAQQLAPATSKSIAPAQVHASTLMPLINESASKEHTNDAMASQARAENNGVSSVLHGGQDASYIAADNIAASPGNKRQGQSAGRMTNGKGGKRTSLTAEAGDNITVKSAASPAAAAASAVAGRARGRGGSSTRAKGKNRATAKTRKRKRGDGEDNSEEDTEDSEVYTSTAVITKSGRSIQRPTTFVPPPAASPTTAPSVKKKRTWRRNPENAVCKLCQRGVSPASNMIVFCDGCNTPYHRWCHHPPIDQSVIDETDKEWYCRQCQRERIVPVAEADVAHFVAAAGASTTERQKFFSRLTPGALVTLLTRATTLYPSLPLFDPDFAAKHVSTVTLASTSQNQATHQAPSIAASSLTPGQAASQPPTIYAHHDDPDEDEGYGPEEHPAHYVRPGHGLMSTLPPDKDDDTHLVDEENSKRVFHHIYLVDETAVNNGVRPG